MPNSDDSSAAVFRLTAAVGQQRVRALAQDSGNIKWSKHVRERMIERGLTSEQVLRILRTGDVEEPPAPGASVGEWKIKITRKMTNGRTAGVVTVLINDRTLKLITAEWEDRR